MWKRNKAFIFLYNIVLYPNQILFINYEKFIKKVRKNKGNLLRIVSSNYEQVWAHSLIENGINFPIAYWYLSSIE